MQKYKNRFLLYLILTLFLSNKKDILCNLLLPVFSEQFIYCNLGYNTFLFLVQSTFSINIVHKFV